MTINTYLPYPDLTKSASCLDDKRLDKQRADVVKIMKACTEDPPAEGEAPEHSAIKMWRGYEGFLYSYAMAIIFEWQSRDNADATLAKIMKLKKEYFPNASMDQPEWWGGDIHASHRSYLKRMLPTHYKELFADTPDDLPMVWPRSPERTRSTAEQRELDRKIKRALKLRDKAEEARLEARKAAVDADLDPDTFEPIGGGELVEIGIPDADLLEL